MGKVFKALEKADKTWNENKGDVLAEGTIAPESGSDKASRTVSKEMSVDVAKENEETVSLQKSTPASREYQGNWDERLLLAVTTSGPVSESIRTLRSRILHPLSGKSPRTILVTSATPGEGKSFITANLGITLAQGVDNYCLLVDCDLRKPNLHSLFGLSNRRGLAEYLREKVALQDLLLPSGADKLSVLPAGPPPVNPSELLGSSSMEHLVDELAKRYDDRLILFDSPPVQAASETAVLAQKVDGIVLVVRWGGSRREHVKKMVDLVGQDKIVGVVFNAYRSNLIDSKVFGYYDEYREYARN